MHILTLFVFGFAWWLGLYLLARSPAKPVLGLTGWGLVVYALGLMFLLLSGEAQTLATAHTLTRLGWIFHFVPALLWAGAQWHLLPEDSVLRAQLVRWWNAIAWIFLSLFVVAAWGTDFIFDFTVEPPRLTWGYAVFAAPVLALLMIGLAVLLRPWSAARSKNPLGLLLIAALFFSLSVGLLSFPFVWLPRDWVVLLAGIDLVVMGIAIARLDAFDEGEALLPDMIRSFAAALLMAVVFGAGVAVVAAWSVMPTLPTLALLCVMIALAVASQALSDQIQAWLDRVVFARFPAWQQARATLRAATNALPRISQTLDVGAMDDVELIRLTRRALSHLGDLPRLATSPLTRLPIIDKRLRLRHADDDALERAAELKSVLIESIMQLKPHDRGEFNTTDEWRYYNALYFPYIVGLKPYSRRADYDNLEPTAKKALRWFQTQVPERTLYNWQSAAAKLIAQRLKEYQNGSSWQ